MDYRVLHTDEIEITDLSTIDEVPPDLDVKRVGEALGVEQLRLSLWYFEPGERLSYHAHAEQEEVYYVIQGEFSVKLGRSGEEEYIDASPGTFWVARPEIGHGHQNISDSQGIILAMGAPAVDDFGMDPHRLDA